MGSECHFPPSGKKLEGKYANYFKVGHNAYEFLFDFGQCYFEIEEAELCSRIITSPYYAKEFLNALTASIEEYEKAYGRIQKE